MGTFGVGRLANTDAVNSIVASNNIIRFFITFSFGKSRGRMVPAKKGSATKNRSKSLLLEFVSSGVGIYCDADALPACTRGGAASANTAFDVVSKP